MKPDLPLIPSQDLANRVLRWFVEDNQPRPARVMAGVVLYGPRAMEGARTPFPSSFPDFLGCLRLAETCQFGASDFDRVRLISPEWNLVVDLWEELARVANANSLRAAGVPLVTFHEKEIRFGAALRRGLACRQLESWTVPVAPDVEAEIRAKSVPRDFHFCGTEGSIQTVPLCLLPPRCLGVIVGDDGRMAFMLSVSAPLPES